MATNLLKGKRGIIFGALNEESIAWKTALMAHEEGAEFVLSNAPIALRMGKIKELGEACNAEVIAADATSVEDLENLFNKASEILGGKIDFVLHSIGMSPNVRKGKTYGDLNYDWFHKTLDISAMSFHKVLQTAEKLDVMNEWGSIVALSYIAAQRSFSHYADMADAKALLESVARGYGARFAAKKVRVNTISQSPTVTTAGQGITGFDDFFNFADQLSPLGNAPSEECAKYILSLFSDYTRYVTMQNLMHDGGFSTCGITEEMMETLAKARQK
ncbi:enoyl-ACP reductase FabI [Persicobacter diffluens]|uniref:Enoyl-[acyl-carrier-protein] reductase [NADH] n=1 Tax=Persicobacter diffluens TaxID=981 RepID=A0AAN5AHX9_9BACT|nr:enoyl-[acyl-carrier-protein] reductase [NADH] [Persicobacter diffluens]